MTSDRGAGDGTSTTALPPDGTNALARATGLLGDEWTLLLLRAAMTGATRYSEFAARMPISNAVLAARLDTLVAESLLERRVYQESPMRAEYVLTQRGRSLWPLLVSIWRWERRWVPEHAYATPPMTHLPCGREMSPHYCCAACGRPAPARAVRTAWGPSGGWRRSVAEVRTRRRSDSRGGGAGSVSFYPDTMAVLGNRWSSAVVGAGLRGVRRFTEFQDLLGVPPSLLAQRLHVLCERGILRQLRIENRPDRAEYRLTEKGVDFFPVIGVVVEWAQRWYRSAEGPVLLWTHADCGAPFRGVLTCDTCDKPLTGTEIELTGT